MKPLSKLSKLCKHDRRSWPCLGSRQARSRDSKEGGGGVPREGYLIIRVLISCRSYYLGIIGVPHDLCRKAPLQKIRLHVQMGMTSRARLPPTMSGTVTTKTSCLAGYKTSSHKLDPRIFPECCLWPNLMCENLEGAGVTCYRALHRRSLGFMWDS